MLPGFRYMVLVTTFGNEDDEVPKFIEIVELGLPVSLKLIIPVQFAKPPIVEPGCGVT